MPKSREGKRPKPVVLPHRMRSSTVACPRWRTSRNWAEPPLANGVSVRKTWCRRPSSWSNRDSWAPGCGRSRRTMMRVPAGWPARSVVPVGSATSAESRRVPSWSGAGCQTCWGRARIAWRTGSVTACPTEKKVRIPRVRRSRTWLRKAFADPALEDVGAVPVGVGDLCESVVQHRDVIRGGVGSRVPGPQPPGRCLAGVGQETQQGVEAEAAFIGGCGLVFFGVAGDQRGVDVQARAGYFPSAGFRRRYAAAGLGCLQPGRFPGLSAGRAQAVQYVFVDAGQ